MLIFKPVVFEATTSFTGNPLMDSLSLDELNTRSFVWKPIDEIDDVHGQNRLF